MIFSVSTFSLRRPDNPKAFLRLPPEGLQFPSPGVYTLEGPNQSGKSTFLKAIVGALPAPIRADRVPLLVVDNTPIRKINSPAAAADFGIVGVFQDDYLIPSLSVLEQLVLKHGRLSLRQFLNFAMLGIYGILIHPWVLLAALVQATRLSSALARLKPGTVGWLETTEIETTAKACLREIGQSPSDLLPMLPAQLSGGKKALAKILSSDIHFKRGRPPRVLLLDEAFSGLQRDLWPVLLERYRRWAVQNRGVVIAVTHNSQEVELWQPLRRLRIEDGVLTSGDAIGGPILQVGIPRPVMSFPSIRLSRGKEDQQLQACLATVIPNKAPIAVFVSPHCVGYSSFKGLLGALKPLSKGAPLVVPLTAAESSLDLHQVTPILERTIVHLRANNGVIVIVGGGSTLNMGGFIASIMFRGVCRTISLPTTILAIADVVVGSKTSVPLSGDKSKVPAPLNTKHSIGTYHNPSLAVIDPRYIDNLTVGEIIIGFSEIIKHGLLQSSGLLERSLSFVLGHLAPLNLQQHAGSSLGDQAILLAEETAALKAEVLALDPFEQRYGKILLYGHLHAHCIERVTMFSIPHGVAVYLGILIELRLSNAVEVFNRIIPILQGSRRTWLSPLESLRYYQLKSVYLTQNKTVHGDGLKFFSLALSAPGEFALGEISMGASQTHLPYEIDAASSAERYVVERERSLEFDEIWKTLVGILKELDVPVSITRKGLQEDSDLLGQL